eukprot:jgi/Tetstr1/427623/TSEL_017748.t1
MGFLPVLFCTLNGISSVILNRPQLAFLVVSLMSCTYDGMFLTCYPVMIAILPMARQFGAPPFLSYRATTFGYRFFGVLALAFTLLALHYQLAQDWLHVSDSFFQGGSPMPPIPNLGYPSLSYGPKPFMLTGSLADSMDPEEHLMRSPPNRGGGLLHCG